MTPDEGGGGVWATDCAATACDPATGALVGLTAGEKPGSCGTLAVGLGGSAQQTTMLSPLSAACSGI